MCLQNSFEPILNFMGRDTVNLDRFSLFKKEATAEEFCQKNMTPFFEEILDTCYKMEYSETPNYKKLTFML